LGVFPLGIGCELRHSTAAIGLLYTTFLGWFSGVVMVYLPKTEAGKKIHELMEECNTAQNQWNTYATQLGRGYTTAYALQKDANRQYQQKPSAEG
jgi:hypothetical protein